MTMLPTSDPFYPYAKAPPPLVIDSSALVQLLACPRKFMWGVNHKLMLPGSNIHLTAGGAFAAGTEAYRHGVYFHNLSHEQAMEHAFLAACRRWGDFGHDPERTKTKPFLSVVRALDAYFRHFPPRTDYLVPQLERLTGEPSVEFSFALPLDDFPHHPSGDPFILAGRFDMLAIDSRTGQLGFVDEKTTYSFGAAWADKFKMRFQFLTYCLALRKLGYDVLYGVVRGVSMLKTRTDFLDVPLHFPPHLLDQHERALRYAISMLVSMHEGTYFPPYMGELCASCQFNPLCYNRSPERWLDLYTTNTWDPLATSKDAGEIITEDY